MDHDKVFHVEIGEEDGKDRYLIDGVITPRLVLTAGVLYTFRLHTPGHPFYITQNPLGGEKHHHGQESGDFEWTPSETDVGKALYYQATSQTKMGYKIRVVSPQKEIKRPPAGREDLKSY